MRAYLPEEEFQFFWEYVSPAWAEKFPNDIEVAVEEYSGFAGQADTWRRLKAEPLLLTPSSVGSGWIWTASVPVVDSFGTKRRRLVVSEFEHLAEDDPSDYRSDPLRTRKIRRLVYVDVVELPPVRFI